MTWLINYTPPLPVRYNNNICYISRTVVFTCCRRQLREKSKGWKLKMEKKKCPGPVWKQYGVFHERPSHDMRMLTFFKKKFFSFFLKNKTLIRLNFSYAVHKRLVSSITFKYILGWEKKNKSVKKWIFFRKIRTYRISQ